MPAESFRLEIDRGRCQGHARCAALAPEIFSVDDEGNGLVLIDGPISIDLLDKAYLASSNCPELAIKITEVGT
jgi:ferredoxin